ncbi:hypothetical protein Bca52824_000806 [Brassica carinata]|uniref:Uncharacterized protein n=1 Tax=Brassica carinata TaxID=52824 RepID=A0A8X7WG94_BRACI|nr:hypothetical protein Bca52824_000806 [Brassica carinata]
MESTHYADHHAFMPNFCGTRLNVTVTNKAEAVRRYKGSHHQKNPKLNPLEDGYIQFDDDYVSDNGDSEQKIDENNPVVDESLMSTTEERLRR